MYRLHLIFGYFAEYVDESLSDSRASRCRPAVEIASSDLFHHISERAILSPGRGADRLHQIRLGIH